MQSAQTLQETVTSLSGDEVLARAKSFFASRPSLYAAFIDREGPTFVSFRGQGTEELVIGVTPAVDGGTRVTGSTYLYDMQVSRFFATLPPYGAPI
jgi:hypothetical protein